MERTVLAIDPGRAKCGYALVRRDSEGKIELLWHAIGPPIEVVSRLEEAKAVAAYSMIVMGQGTTSGSLQEKIREAAPSMAILLVDERDTSIQARERYWEHHKRRGWRRLLPSSLQVPPVPIDDFAALVIAEKVLL